MMYRWIYLIHMCLLSAKAAPNLLSNADFESTNYNGNWYCSGCHMEPSADAYQGQHSGHVIYRDQRWAGASQNVNLTGGSRYKATAYLKLLNLTNSNMYQDVEMTLSCKDSNGKSYYEKFGTTPHMLPNIWYQVGGALQVHPGSHECRIYVQTDAHAHYLIDSANVELIPNDNDWKTQANNRINQLRKAGVTISLAGTDVAKSNVTIELKQTKMEFIFGSAVSASKIVATDTINQGYQQAFYHNFEWGVLENALKWSVMEPSKGHIQYDRPLNAINAIRSHGIKMRCHCVFWGKDVQSWVKALHGDDLRAAIHDRVTGIVGHTKGMCEQWDVNNEMLHGDFYERNTRDPHITQDMFRQIHAVDGHPLLFLNDYSIINYHETAVAMKDLALKYKAAGVPIGGIGVQGHMKQVDIHLIKAYLDILEEAGLPVMITEFAVNDKDEHSKANHLRDMLTLFFSHPAVKGVIFWGFWDGQLWEQDAALFTGNNVTANEAGRVYQEFFHNTWRTYVTHTIHDTEQYHVTAFKGEYVLNVKHNGQVIKSQTFTLDNGGKTLQVHLNGNTGGAPSVSHVIVG